MVRDIMPKANKEYSEHLQAEMEYIIANSYCRGLTKEDFF